ncbi:HIT family protein [Mycobacterium aquaticum]|uniref:HIT domain-containing protein n=1 Tax=Mycobacterium aquaticum TaxID=1927124 RepID=A0A1X0A0Y8_9MYCO|nr:HIT family protein [Mycobacterium aquaticum]ORA23416.1 hypothetical protein BST13_35270 [Mycobacterium aquaticum]
MTKCPFCKPNWGNLDIVQKWMGGCVAIVNPLNPVTEGHVLVIHWDHDESAAVDIHSSRRAAMLMAVAADYVNTQGLQANIITSIGPDATQTVFHTHVHVVPRRPNDGLTLPWTDQSQACGAVVHPSYYSGPFVHPGSRDACKICPPLT